MSETSGNRGGSARGRNRRSRGRGGKPSSDGGGKGGGPQSSGGKGSGKGGKGSSGGGRRRSQNNRRGRNRGQSRQEDTTSFWGDVASLPTPKTDVRITDDPDAVPRSLGTPPLPGQEAIAGHYFAAVYDRAVATAGALAAAGGLIDPNALTDDEG